MEKNNEINHLVQYPKNINEFKNLLKKLMNYDYELFIKSLISIEKDIDNPNLLDELYEEYRTNDELYMFNDFETLNDYDYLLQVYNSFRISQDKDEIDLDTMVSQERLMFVDEELIEENDKYQVSYEYNLKYNFQRIKILNEKILTQKIEYLSINEFLEELPIDSDRPITLNEIGIDIKMLCEMNKFYDLNDWESVIAIGGEHGFIVTDALTVKNANKDITMERLLERYNEYSLRNFDDEGVEIDVDTLKNLEKLNIGYTELDSDESVYEIEIYYDLNRKVEVIKIWNSFVTAYKEHQYDYKMLMSNLNLDLNDFIAEYNTGVYLDDLDKISLAVANKDFVSAIKHINSLDYKIILENNIKEEQKVDIVKPKNHKI